MKFQSLPSFLSDFVSLKSRMRETTQLPFFELDFPARPACFEAGKIKASGFGHFFWR